MAITVIKAEQVVRALLGALQRDVVLPNLIWLDPAGDFVGAKNDTITLTIPAVTSARTRGLRSGTTRNRDSLAEGKVAITLDTDLYKDVQITDEEMTLDIADFGRQVLAPISTAMVEGWEDTIADTMTGATYAKSVEWDASDVFGTLVEASSLLDKARVPRSGRAVALGANLAKQVVLDSKLSRYDGAGDLAMEGLRTATIASVAGFRITTIQGLDPDAGFAFHRTAYAATSKAPMVPDSIKWGQTTKVAGLAMRAIKAFDSSADGWVEVLGFDSFIGCDTVKDHGEFNASGQFVPAASPDNTDDTDLVFVRAIDISDTSS